ncbi:neutral/alkaline non-lysosomal ceramidase [Microdochium trichocladiopsis]|uniref:Neutral ceramidase n=1 Tax=Microdochium trichocladiopsis TaxID=1682393 RepID=A0A9P8YJQ2_9PEZI|nr:neutral/alkaline non-lysosomal ceramidase [Microdochium trichocladiopsis]KAH7040284.1 neutral/alkaline non-lysosomal ceramidase [Microdochium trichocladiopsis]
MGKTFARAASTAPRSVLVLFSIFSLFSLGVLFSSSSTGKATLAKAGWSTHDDHARFQVPPHREPRQQSSGDKYLLGVGKADITGPVVEIGFAGYADLNQVGTGLRQRIHSRAFIVGDVNKPQDRFIYLLLDISFGDTGIRRGILEGIAALGGEYAVYGAGNVAVTGTHSHSGPGAWFNYLLPQITTLGFDKASYRAIVDGAVLSVKRAHESLQEGYLDFGMVNIEDSNLSRSLYAYMANPAEERAQYSDSVDKEMTVLRFQRASDSKNIGVLTWFPVHPTSIYQNNTHVTGDNKGVAELMFEKAMAGHSSAAEGFVAGFSQANVGDTTPNVLGAWCDDGSGLQCSYENATCANGMSQACHGRGPFYEKQDKGVASCYEIGKRQYDGARSVYDSLPSAGTPVVGSSVKSFHFFHDMRFWNFQLENGTQVQTCPAALGYSFAAGTTDGPGFADFTQGDSGDPDASPIWLAVKSLLRVPTAAQVKCQGKKPVLLDAGEQSVPYDWSANIVDVQMLRVGQFVIIVSPSEATTMAGRRWRNAVKAAATDIVGGGVEPKVVLGGPANTYAHYVTTPEEFDIQRYEGASTLYGKWELNAYINLTVSNIQYLAPDATGAPSPGPEPQDNRNSSLSFITGVVYDSPGIGQSYGAVLSQPAVSYTRGAVVNATFVGANPRNNFRLEGTFTAVEKRQSDGTWSRVRDDTDYHLVYYWKRTNGLLGTSTVTVSWETEADAAPGVYRLKYYGDAKAFLGGVITAFEGTSSTFTLS